MAIVFYQKDRTVYGVHYKETENQSDVSKLEWLFGEAKRLDSEKLDGFYIGPRREMITPWSTNAVEITQNMGINGILRIEEFQKTDSEHTPYDPMLQLIYSGLDQHTFTIDRKPEPILYIEDIKAYNQQEGLALNEQEIEYLEGLAVKLGRSLTDSEVFGFSQVNSEHCRHKIFGGTFIVDGEQKESSPFQLIKKTSAEHPNRIVSAYKDNCAFIEGPKSEQFAPATPDKPDFYETRAIDTVLSLKAETHNFPTTVEPFNGAATGSGGEIRDRIAGGQASIPSAGTAVYMTSYPRLDADRNWEKNIDPRQWLYQTPEDILIKASNGASDFGNKFGQPVITGSVLTFEHEENDKTFGYDKVIMQAGGIGYGNREQALKHVPEVGDKVVLLGGDNYRIGMGGGAVSSVDTGQFAGAIELNAVQRSNPEMQRRVCNAIRGMAEGENNPIISIHDHGAGGHLNCLSELVEETGGMIHLDKLPVGDPTLSAKEIVGNESQERMGLVIKEKDVAMLQQVADRERAPMYVIGEATGDHRFTFENFNTGEKPIDLELNDMFGNPPKTIMKDETKNEKYADLKYDSSKLEDYLEQVLQIEAVACKDWLTNKADRSVSGRIALQQCTGQLQLPLNNLGVVAMDYLGKRGMATSIGHAPVAAMQDSAKGSRLAIAEALTNMIWAPIEQGIKGVSLSANWMWPCKNPGEDARLYNAVQAVSDFAIALGVNVPTGKDSLSMTQKYGDKKVYAPGTVIISTVGEVSDINKIKTPVLKQGVKSEIIHIDFSSDAFKLAGSSFAQTLNKIGADAPDVKDASYFVKAFTAVQQLIENGDVLAGHDISAGGMLVALLEMCFSDNRLGLDIDFSHLTEKDMIKICFAENPGVLLQLSVDSCKKVSEYLDKQGVKYNFLGTLGKAGVLNMKQASSEWKLDIASLRDLWFKTSYLLDRRQSGSELALERYKSYKNSELSYIFPKHFTGKLADMGLDMHRKTKSGIKAAVIREKGCQCERETAWALYLAGFDVKDVHMTDLISGRETLEDVNMIAFVGGFSNSDVLGSAKGWAGAFKYNEKAKRALDNFYKRTDTLSVGLCNGCQLMMELDLVYPDHKETPKMVHNNSHKFESGFVNVTIGENNSVMLKSLAGSRLGVWIAHGEGKFNLPYGQDQYHIPMRYSYDVYPANPNGSPSATAAMCSQDGRHLAMMPHPERAIHAWNWPYYAEGREGDEVSPWIEAFVNARKWIEGKK
ncbi:phosphoribosylformylglycinamidine synthase [Odoribacter sp. OttesenSCG-928-J03]|nr:phosphoribosylformylglycinamidine synthase [Odoribacter sp. OttesenSCG-928-J03]MDL2330462.1 phosphoribosylformylglycinamidine synthase [Odoribacter sp. OttesenSCG-928-A06]